MHNKETVRPKDFLTGVMADRGCTIKKQSDRLDVTLNIPAFLGGKDQLSHYEVTESQTIAAVKIHVERAIQRIN